MSFSPRPRVIRVLKKTRRTICVLLVFGVLLQTIVFCQVQNANPANQVLLKAAYDLDLEAAKRAVQDGADVDATDQYGHTALIVVSGNEFDPFEQKPRAREELARFLLKSGANPNIRLSGDPVGIGATALLGSIEFDQIAVTKLLLENGADPKLADRRGRTPICMAAYRQNIESINLLLASGVVFDEGYISCNPMNACMESASKGKDNEGVKACFSRLIEAKADPNRPGTRLTQLTPLTPLIEATLYGYLDLVKFLLEKGARADAEGTDGSTALYYAKSVEIGETLLRAGADVNHRNKLGLTPLMVAGSAEEATLLLKHGARINDVDNDGLTALVHATSQLNPQLVQALLRYKPNLSLKPAGTTLFHVIFDHVHSRSPSNAKLRQMVELFVKSADLNEKDSRGTYPIHIAAGIGSASLIQMMVRNGADLLVKDAEGKTPLDIIRQTDRRRAAVRLIEDVLAQKSGLVKGNPPKSFWNQFAVPLIEGRPALAPADPDPIRQGQLEDLSLDLLKNGFSDTDGDLPSFWERMPEAQRAILRRQHPAVFGTYDPLRTFMPDDDYVWDTEAETTASRLVSGIRQPIPNPTSYHPDLPNPFEALNLSDGPLTALSAAHLAASLPKSLGMNPELMQRAARRSFLFGTFSQLYGASDSSGSVVGFDEAQRYFDGRVKIIGADLMRLYRAQRPLLTNTFHRPMPQLAIKFQLSRERTYSSVNTSSAVPKRYASLSYEDVVDSFHACIIDGLEPIMESDDFFDSDREKYLSALFGSLPSEMRQMTRKDTSDTSDTSEPPSISREEAIEQLKSIKEKLFLAGPLSLQDIARIGPSGKFLSDLLLGLAKARPQKKDIAAFMKPYEGRFKELERRHEENDKKFEEESDLVQFALGEFAVNAFLYDASRKVETQFNNVLQFALAHEIGHHVFGTVDKHDVSAEDDADEFAVTLLTGAYVHLSLTDLQVLDGPNSKRKTGTRLVVLDGNTLRKYIGYPIYFGARLKQSETHSPLTSNYRTADERVKLLTDQFRAVYRVLQSKIFADRIKTYQRRQVSRTVMDEFTSVVTLVGERRPKR